MIDTYRIVTSFRHAIAGLSFAVEHDQNLRIHFCVAAIVVVASIFFQVSPFEMGILGVMILLVISTEMINSAIEQMVNLITTEHRQEAKVAKDVAAGMVLVTTLGSIIVGILIFVPHIEKLLQ